MRSTLLALLLPLSAQAAGNLSYVLETAASPTSDQTEAYAAIRKAMDSAVGYYNKYTSLRKNLRVQYNTGVNTADGNSNGTIRFGSNRSYMQVGTAMHEIAHTLGLGTTSAYTSLMVGGQWQGAAGIAALKELDGSSATLKGDAQHFWPYGINYESEVKGVATLVGHCKIVQAMYQDMHQEKLLFEGRIRARGTNRCMVRDGNVLEMGICTDSTSRMRIVSMGETDVTCRMEFGDKVLDTPNESSAGGVAMGLYDWNGGAHQTFRMEGTPYAAIRTFRLKMAHSDLYLTSNAVNVTQNAAVGSADQDTQLWELLDDAVGIAPRRASEPHRDSPERRDALGRTRTPTSRAGERLAPGF